MAWQSPSAQNQDGSGSSNNGTVNGGSHQQNGNGQQHSGTEYTLQGVMRFLQTEWHRHERDRNAWEIERADMKARIAKMEGDNRAAKRLQQAYLQRVKMLELALKQERNKNKTNGLSNGTSEEAEKDVVDLFPEEQFPSDSIQADVARGKSKAYLEKCIQEITYLLTPTNHPAPPQPMEQSPMPMQLQGRQHPQQHQTQYSNDELHYMQQQARQGLLHPQGPPPSHPPPRPQPPPDYSSGPLPHLQQQDPRHLNDNQYKQYQSAITGGNPYADSSDRGNIFNSSSIYSSDISDNNPFSNVAALKGSVFDNPSADGSDNWDFEDSNNNANAKPPQGPATQDKAGDSLGYTGGNAKQHGSRLSVGKRKGSLSKRQHHHNQEEANARTGHATANNTQQVNDGNFKVRFALRGHLDVIRAVVFTGGGTATEPEVCTAGDDGVIKRWNIPGTYHHGSQNDTDVQSHFTHRGHAGIVTSLAACPTADSDGWVFSGGQDSTIKVWQKGKVDAKATLEGHTDTVWTLCVLPNSSTLPAGKSSESVYLASGSADGTVRIWSVTAPVSPYASTRLSMAGRKNKKIDIAPEFTYSLLSTIKRSDGPSPSPTCITSLSITGNNFIVSYDNAEIIVYDTAAGEEVVAMSSLETYDGTKATGVNTVVASAVPLEPGEEGDAATAGATGTARGIAGVVFSGHEDGYIRFFDANSGQCSYNMLAHPSSIASLSLSPDGKELVSAGHDASLRFWNLEKRSCAQEITTHRLLRGEGVCAVVWSSDGRWVVSGGGDGVAKVFSRR